MVQRYSVNLYEYDETRCNFISISFLAKYEQNNPSMSTLSSSCCILSHIYRRLKDCSKSTTIEQLSKIVSEVLVHETVDDWVGHVVGEVHIEN